MFNYKIVFRKKIHYETRILRDKMMGFSEVCVLEASDPLASSVGLWTHLGTFLSLVWDTVGIEQARQDFLLVSGEQSSSLSIPSLRFFEKHCNLIGSLLEQRWIILVIKPLHTLAQIIMSVQLVYLPSHNSSCA